VTQPSAVASATSSAGDSSTRATGGARPSLDEVLALRADRMATVRQAIADLTDEKLTGRTEQVMEPGYPEPESFPILECLLNILNEEWEHRLYAERDFDVLESRSF
jgi:hypothetical protein